MISTHLTANYADGLYNFLKQVESQDRVNGDLLPYFDSKGLVTIGVGFNIEGPKQDWLLRVVLKQFGLDPTAPGLSDTQRAAEQGWLNQISAAILANYSSDTALQGALNQVMYNRSIDSALSALPASKKRGYFRFNDGSEVRAVFDAIIPSYESKLDAWLIANGINATAPSLMAHDNKEREALVSLAYQGWIGNTSSSPMLARALRNNDRAEAWYEIRYNTNNEARRFLEADTFGLYNAGTLGEEDYKAAYRMLTRHRTDLFGADGVPGGGDDYEQKNQGRLTTAIAWGNSLNIRVTDLNGNLAPAAEYLLAQYEAPGIPVSWDHIQVGETTADPATGTGSTLYYKGTDADLLVGSAQSDLIFGESGTDILDGGADSTPDVLHGGAGNDLLIAAGGPDILKGGPGRDVYLIKAGAGPVTIDDEDGLGRLFYEDAQGNPIALTGGWTTYGPAGAGTPGTYLSPDPRLTYQRTGTTLTIRLDGAPIATVLNVNPRTDTLGLRLTERTYPLERATLTEANADGGGGEVFDGTDGADRIHADPTPSGGSEINGQRGADLLYGGNEGDWLHGNDLAGTYLVAGGLGPDGYYVFTSHVGTGGLPEFDLNDHDILDAGSNRGRRPDGSYEADRLFGDEGDDLLYGGPLQARLNGGFGNDVLFGEGDSDYLNGGAA